MAMRWVDLCKKKILPYAIRQPLHLLPTKLNAAVAVIRKKMALENSSAIFA
jgi:hypothetical protein